MGAFVNSQGEPDLLPWAPGVKLIYCNWRIGLIDFNPSFLSNHPLFDWLICPMLTAVLVADGQRTGPGDAFVRVKQHGLNRASTGQRHCLLHPSSLEMDQDTQNVVLDPLLRNDVACSPWVYQPAGLRTSYPYTTYKILQCAAQVVCHRSLSTLHGKTQGFVLRLPPHNTRHATFIQPYQCDLQPQLQAKHRTTHTGTTIVANHIEGTKRPQPHPPPFIAGCSHFTRKKTRFRAPASSPQHTACNIHAAIPMRSATTASRNE